MKRQDLPDTNLLDPRLLRLFDALFATGSVTKAAEKLGQSQPTVSIWLARLRQELDDPLFVQYGSGFAPYRGCPPATHGFPYYDYNLEFSVTLWTERVIAVTLSLYYDSGNGHPLGIERAAVFDVVRRRVLAIADLIDASALLWRVHLLGGDTDRRPGPLTISISIVGEVEAGRMIRRGTARPGEALFVSGSLGDAALGLALRKDPKLADVWGLLPVEAEHLRQRYVRPQPRLGRCQ